MVWFDGLEIVGFEDSLGEVMKLYLIWLIGVWYICEVVVFVY